MSAAAGEGASVDGTKDSKATPVFGSASTFGGGSGFAGFSGVDNSATPSGFSNGAQEASTRDEDTTDAANGAADDQDDEDCSAEFKPVVQLDEVDVQTGEEGEEVLFDFKCKLYRYSPESDEWKERGVGQMKLLRHEGNDLVRVLMRQDKTLKIRANHIVMPKTNLQEHSGNEKSVVWSAVDFDGEKQTPEMFCVRFASPERAQQFIADHGKAMSHNEKVLEKSGAAGGVQEDDEQSPSPSKASPSKDAQPTGDSTDDNKVPAAEGQGPESEAGPTAQQDADELARRVGTVKVADGDSDAPEGKPVE